MTNNQDYINITNKEELNLQMCRPEGTLFFYIDNLTKDEEIHIFKQVSGNHIFQIIHNKQNELIYYYSSSRTNTRVASIKLPNNHSLIENIKITITWSPTDIALYAGNSNWFISTKGKNSPIHFQADSEGNIIQIGDVGVEVKEVRIISKNKLVLSPSAINTWKDTIDVLETLKSGESKLGYIYSVAIANVSIVTLVFSPQYLPIAKYHFNEFIQKLHNKTIEYQT